MSDDDDDDDGFEQALAAETRDLVALAREHKLGVVDFRDAEIAAAIEHLDQGRSVLLVGPTGAGKTAVVHGIAAAMAARGAGLVFETSTVGLFAGTRYLGEWQTKLTRIANAAEQSGATLFITDIGNLPRAGRTQQSDTNLLDALRPYVESGRVRLLAEASPELLSAMQRVPGFVRLFQTVDVFPLDDEQVALALDRAAERKGAKLDDSSRKALVKLTSRFLAARPQPGPALALLEQVVDYQEQKRGVGEHEAITPPFIERVFAIRSGLPPFVVSRAVTIPAADIRAWFSDRIVGQRAGIEAVVEAIALFKAGLHDPSRPIGTFLFVGPTGVGKTELARALATFVFGSPQRLLRFDLSEFKDYSSFEMLLGDPQRPEQPARLLDPVRAHPFQVVLLDELEKAHPNIWDLLLPLLDEGRLTAPGGDTVDFRNTIVIATSNVGAQESSRSLGFAQADGEGDRKEQRTREALEAAFRPEFLNRFGHVVVFHALSREELRSVARHEIAHVLRREGIVGQNLVVDVDDAALDLVIAEGLDERYGARALKREVQTRIVLPLAMTLMERHVVPGSIIKVTSKEGRLRIRVLETEASRLFRIENEPVRADGRILTRNDLAARIAAAAEQVEALATALDLPKLAADREKLLEQRNVADFWKNAVAAERVQRDLDRVAATLDRVEHLRDRTAEAERALVKATARAELDRVVGAVQALELSAADAHRELVVLGWEGNADAIVEVRPVGGTGREARDLLVQTYVAWAEHGRMAVEWLRDPMGDDEPAMLAVKGPYAFGMLRGEAGLHRLKLGDDEASKLVVAGVRISAWSEARGPAAIVRERPLKAIGQLAGKVRSRLECEGLVLQNGRTLAENRELAVEVRASWLAAPAPVDDVVRRYDRTPPLLRDALTGFSSGRPDALAPAAFDTLLRLRLDEAARAGKP